MKGLFITGTDTGVGKTIVTGCLARYLTERGENVITQKWIQTGCSENFSQDIQIHLKIMRRKKRSIKEYLSYVNPYIFKPAYSPHLASKIESKKVDSDKIKKSFKLLSDKFDVVLVEGIGGALVPFNQKRLVIDIVKDLDLDVVVVVQNKLGAINHALLTIEALRARKIKILGMIFNNLKQENKKVLENNPLIVKKLSNELVFGVLPWIEDYQRLYKKFITIGDRIYDKFLD